MTILTRQGYRIKKSDLTDEQKADQIYVNEKYGNALIVSSVSKYWETLAKKNSFR